MKIEDILAPSQYDPNNAPEVLDSFELELKWFGSKRHARIARIKLHENSYDFFIAWRFDEDDGAWFLTSDKHSERPVRLWDLVIHEKIIQQLRSAIGMGAFCRAFFLAEHNIHVGITSHSGTFFDWTTNRPVPNFYLHWNSIKNQQCSVTFEALNRSIINPNSDAGFALRILKAGAFEARALAFGFEDVNQYKKCVRNFERLISLALYSSNPLWESNANYQVNVSLKEETLTIMRYGDLMGTTSLEKEETYWIELIKHFGPLKQDAERRKKHRWLQRYQALVSFRLAVPTYHERFEAKLQLLEWAKAHLPPEKYSEAEAIEAAKSL